MFEEVSIHFNANYCATHGILSKTLHHVGLDRRHSWSKSCRKNSDNSGRDCIKVILQISPLGKNPSETDPATKKAMQSAFDVQSTFLDISLSTAPSHLTLSVPDLHCADKLLPQRS